MSTTPYVETGPEPTPVERQLARWHRDCLAARAEVDRLREFFRDGIDAYDASVANTAEVS